MELKDVLVSVLSHCYSAVFIRAKCFSVKTARESGEFNISELISETATFSQCFYSLDLKPVWDSKGKHIFIYVACPAALYFNNKICSLCA